MGIIDYSKEFDKINKFYDEELQKLDPKDSDFNIKFKKIKQEVANKRIKAKGGYIPSMIESVIFFVILAISIYFI